MNHASIKRYGYQYIKSDKILSGKVTANRVGICRTLNTECCTELRIFVCLLLEYITVYNIFDITPSIL